METITMREWAASEIEYYRKLCLSFPTDRNKKCLDQWESDLAWYKTDEPRKAWRVVGVFECPVIYTEYGEWDDWTEDFDDDMLAGVIITEITITGREAGDLEYFEP